jgi:zinc-finger of transposase IS204/IS1001/IS1096/IS1165
LPQFAAATVDSVELGGDLVTFRVRAKAGNAACPGCRRRSSRVHARYQRQLADLPLGGRRVQVIAHIRRFKCVSPRCAQSTFSEQIPGLTTPFARRTPPLTGALVKVALALAGRPGSRLSAELAMPSCRDVLIRLIRAQPIPAEVETATKEGADKRRKRATPSTLRTDRTVTVATVIGIGGAATAGISTLIFIPQVHVVAETISQQSSFGILPADGILFGLTIGLIVACFNTAWPTYALAHCWLVLAGRSPIRLERFIDELHHAQILRREGSYVMFRHYEFQRYLSEHGDEFALMPPPRPSRRRRESVACLPRRLPSTGRSVRDPRLPGPDFPSQSRQGAELTLTWRETR